MAASGSIDPLIGRSLGNHTILAPIGRGGMGAVYVAEHAVLGRKAAIKVLLPEYSNNAELTERFFVEAKATARLRHRAFVEVFDSGRLPDGSAYLIMEYLEGETLGARLERAGAVPATEALPIVREIADGVGYAHEHGIVHRDLKPDNVFLVASRDGVRLPRIEIKVLDFGIAKLTTAGTQGGSHTRTGMVLGTPLFMAPEQCRGAGRIVIDHRADLYALGCIIHAALSGAPPFPLEGVGEIIAAHISEPPPPLRSLVPAVPPPLEALVLRLLAKKPEDRPASMAEVVGELDRCAHALGLAGDAGGTPAERAKTAMSTPAGAVVAGGTRLLQERQRPGSQSTLGAAAAALETRPRRSPRRALALTGGAVAVLAAVVAVVFVLRPGARPVEPPPPEHAAAPAPPPPAPPPAPAAAPAAHAEETRLPAPPAESAPLQTVTVRISSTPAGATVVEPRKGTVLGTTPYKGVFAAAPEPVRLELRKSRFYVQSVEVSRARDSDVAVTLRKKPAAAAPAPEDDSEGRKL
jgi:serine/threonine-protein kinase